MGVSLAESRIFFCRIWGIEGQIPWRVFVFFGGESSSSCLEHQHEHSNLADLDLFKVFFLLCATVNHHQTTICCENIFYFF